MPLRMRILPVLIGVLLIAFSFRLAGIIRDMGDLKPGSLAKIEPAAGEEDAHEGEEKRAESNPILFSEADVKQEEPDHAEEAMAHEEEDGELPIDWRAQGEPDLEFTAVQMELFKDLTARRKEIEKAERALHTREALLKAAEQELDRKYQELSQLRREIEKLLETQSEEEGARIKSLVKIYEGMKPKDAARIFDTLDIDILVSVVGKMSERKLSPILAKMNPERARTITIMLAEQKQLPSLPQSN